MAGINIDDLASEIAQALSVYSRSVVKQINISSEKVGKEAVKRLKQTSPKDSGDYAKSWRMKTEPALGQPDSRIIHVAKPHYRLTHLLEFGHAKANGGRVEARPHIKQAEQEVIDQFTKEVEEAIRSG